MALPEPVKHKAEQELAQFCENRVPVHARDQVRLSFLFRGNSVTLREERPHFLNPRSWTKMAIAQFRYDDGLWTLYCRDRNERWFEYIDAKPSRDLNVLLDEVADDPTGIFWG